MAENSKIEWTDHTFNPWEGCTKVGAGCDNCYAETRNARYAGGKSINWGMGAPRRRTSEANWQNPIKWNANADAFFAEHGRRQRVFCASLADVFDNEVNPHWRKDLFMLIEATPNLDWLLLTKRIGNVASMVFQSWMYEWPKHVWLGATVVNQMEADRDIPKLIQIPAKVRFLSIEPLLGAITLNHINLVYSDIKPDGSIKERKAISWVIVGGESGSNARPMHPDWASSLRDQCKVAGVPFLFKQWGEFAPNCLCQKSTACADVPRPAGGLIGCMFRCGKKAAGRVLDGETYSEYPQVTL
jgi:protein gp37